MRPVLDWMKKYWELLVGALLLFAGFAFGISIARRRAPVAQPNPTKDEAEKEAEKEIKKVEQQAADAKADALKDNAEEKSKELEQIVEKTDDVRDSTDETNKYLKFVSEDIRGEKDE